MPLRCTAALRPATHRKLTQSGVQRFQKGPGKQLSSRKNSRMYHSKVIPKDGNRLSLGNYIPFSGIQTSTIPRRFYKETGLILIRKTIQFHFH